MPLKHPNTMEHRTIGINEIDEDVHGIEALDDKAKKKALFKLSKAEEAVRKIGIAHAATQEEGPSRKDLLNEAVLEDSKTMDFIKKEIEHLRKVIPADIVEALHPLMCQFLIQKTKHKRAFLEVAFPAGYPSNNLVVTIKSKTISETVCLKIKAACEKAVNELKGKMQVEAAVKVAKDLIFNNKLIMCIDELMSIKKHFVKKGDILKMNDKTGVVKMTCKERGYFYTLQLNIPDEYPAEKPDLLMQEHNFTPTAERIFCAQTEEALVVAHRNIKAKKRKSDPDPEPAPCIKETLAFFSADLVHRWPREKCPYCKKDSIASNPDEARKVPREMRAERILCGHLFHGKCLDSYMSQPPFPPGGKTCSICNEVVYHKKYNLDASALERRWAFKEARIREVLDVSEFLNVADEHRIADVDVDGVSKTVSLKQ